MEGDANAKGIRPGETLALDTASESGGILCSLGVLGRDFGHAGRLRKGGRRHGEDGENVESPHAGGAMKSGKVDVALSKAMGKLETRSSWSGGGFFVFRPSPGHGQSIHLIYIDLAKRNESVPHPSPALMTEDTARIYSVQEIDMEINCPEKQPHFPLPWLGRSIWEGPGRLHVMRLSLARSLGQWWIK